MPPTAVLRPPMRATTFSHIVWGGKRVYIPPYVGGAKKALGRSEGASEQTKRHQAAREAASSQRGIKQPERQQAAREAASSQRGVRTVREASGQSERRQGGQRSVRTVREASGRSEGHQSGKRSVRAV